MNRNLIIGIIAVVIIALAEFLPFWSFITTHPTL